MSSKITYFMLLCAGLLFLTGCSGSSPSGRSESTTAPAPPRAELDNLPEGPAAVEGLALEQSYRADVVLTTGGGERIEGRFEFVSPDRYHTFINGSIPIEVIAIGSETFVKSGGRWQQAEPTSLPFSAVDLLRSLASIAAGEPAGRTGEGCLNYDSRGSPAAEICIDGHGRLVSALIHDGATTVSLGFADFGSRIDIKRPI